MAKYTITVELSDEDKACVIAVLRFAAAKKRAMQVAAASQGLYLEGLADDADALDQMASALSLAEPMTEYDLELEAQANAHEEHLTQLEESDDRLSKV